ncbi:MAG: hypothetical protein JWR37_1105, partial [Mycobacterium sp.]|nr:hypothetical protein [Mycobacterium sp.]
MERDAGRATRTYLKPTIRWKCRTPFVCPPDGAVSSSQRTFRFESSMTTAWL